MLFFQRTGLAALLFASQLSHAVSDPISLDASRQGLHPRDVIQINLGVPPPPDTAIPASPARTLCSPDGCPQYCKPGSKKKRSFLGGFTDQIDALHKRFFEPTRPSLLVNELLEQSYTSDMSVEYEWHPFDTNQYASAIKGLSGCTAIIVASQKGVFTAHLWEEDTYTKADLQLANYQKTMQTLNTELSAHKNDLVNGEAFIMLLSQVNNKARDLYPAEIVTAIKNTVASASGLTPNAVPYVPLDWKKSNTLGTNQRGTAAAQYDPAYRATPGAQPLKAYRLWMESTSPISAKTW